ncbi:DUF6597 domain-containing transcriptional factor [Marinactinospora thermotolerans]|uniref:Transcriptional regulator, AraC family n=1 Tax=Marinactinospora thermotolerans DSM 45154 TaxID=1122192 RepID=A0A1T4LX66_9ACTN|nr:AraC family transcriptional regulator [Marinactinospora thermotolerans]SJZ59339.1 transcriptional regulator, AraC family [Marinactinospora thermotolerans DSM 45154]
MVEPVERDARGILAPERGLNHFRLHRHAPSREVARFVDRYWLVDWDLRGRAPYVQRVFAHPVVNLVFGPVDAGLHGPTTRVGERELRGAGRALGVMFRPAGFRPFLGGPMTGITDRTVDPAEVFGARVRELAVRVETAADPETMVAHVDRFLAERLPTARVACEDTADLVERMAADPSVTRVEEVAAREGIGVRRLQRRFADHVGLGPKAVIRRYRLYEVAERARSAGSVDWAALAAELGYSDQSHLVREFTRLVGTPPARYSRASRAGRGA